MPFPFQAALAADVGCSPRNAIERMFCRLPSINAMLEARIARRHRQPIHEAAQERLSISIIGTAKLFDEQVELSLQIVYRTFGTCQPER